MSATMHYSFAPDIPVNVRFGVPFDADDQALFRATHEGQNPPGTLWERVAETPSNAPARLTARQDEGIVRAYRSVAQRAAINDVRQMQGHGPNRYGTNGPRAIIGGEYTHPWSAHGIISAGERVK